MLAPVAKELLSRDREIAVLALTTAPSVFRLQGVETFGIEDIVDQVEGYALAKELGAWLANGQSASALVSKSETEAYLGVGYGDLVRTHGAAIAEQRFAEIGRQAFLPISFFRQLFSQARPRGIVATNSPRSERAALESARFADIPSVCLVDLYARWEIEWCAQPAYADRICVLNSHVADHFAARGVPSDKLSVTGNPAFDRLSTIDYNALRERFRTRHGMGLGQRVVAFISQPEPELHPFSLERGDVDLPLRIERELAASFGDDPNVVLAFRLHPSEDRDHVERGYRILHSTAADALDELLCAADCIVTSSSTVGVEAGLLGIPVVQAMASVFSADLPLVDMGYAQEARTIADIGQAVRRALDLPRSCTNATPPPAIPRVVDVIQEITGS